MTGTWIRIRMDPSSFPQSWIRIRIDLKSWIWIRIHKVNADLFEFRVSDKFKLTIAVSMHFNLR
jgi:hypothetical protein